MNIYGNSMTIHGLSGTPFNNMSSSIVVANQERNKGKSKEVDFEAAFAQVAASLQQQASAIEEVTDDVEGLTEVMEKTHLEQDEVGTDADFKKYTPFLADFLNDRLKNAKDVGGIARIRSSSSSRRYGEVGS